MLALPLISLFALERQVVVVGELKPAILVTVWLHGCTELFENYVPSKNLKSFLKLWFN